jgi:ligand-binding sensor domain-containing protein
MNDLVVISNTVWIAGSGGGLAWAKGSTTPVIHTSASGLSGNQINAVSNCALPGFGVVFGGPTGLHVGEPRTGRWRHIDSSNSGLRWNDVSTLFCDVENGFLIVGFAEHGIAIYDAEEDEWRHLDRNSGLAANDARRIAVEGDRSQIWVASDEGVTVSAGADSTFYDSDNSPLETDRVGALVAGDNGTVWLGGDGALYRVDGDEWTVYAAGEVEGGLPSELITGMAFGPDGSLWLGSSDAEICRFELRQEQCADYYTGESGMAPGPLTNLAVDAGGDVYYTTANNGYSVFDGSAWRTLSVREPGLIGNRVKALAQDADGNLWAATETGVQRLVAGDQPMLFDAANSGISPLGVRTLHPGADNGMWVGGRQGASFFDGEEWQTLTAEEGMASDNVQAIAIDSEGRTWIGGDRGISIWNGSSFFVIDADQGLPSDDIRALAAAEDGMWIGTAGGGLYHFAGSQLQLLNSRNVGLPSDNITALAAGSDGALWIGTDRGLARLADGAVSIEEAVSDDEISALAVGDNGDVWAAKATGGVYYGSDGNWTELGVGDGLPAARITSLATDSSTVWLGGQDGGIGVFTPAQE